MEIGLARFNENDVVSPHLERNASELCNSKNGEATSWRSRRIEKQVNGERCTKEKWKKVWSLAAYTVINSISIRVP